MVEGLNRPALVHYRLVPQADGRSTLRRRLWYLNENNQLVHPGDSVTPPSDRVSLLTHGVLDLKVAFFFKETTSQEIGATTGVGNWYHIGNVDEDWEDPGRALRDVDEQRGMLAARGERALSLYHQNQFDGMNAVSFLYEGVGRLENQQAGGVVLRGLDADPSVDLATLTVASKNDYDPAANFSGVRPGDKVFIYDATDDDAQQAVDPSGAAAPRVAGALFPDQVFTVSLIYTDAGEKWVAVKFDEPISFFQLGNDWLGDRGGGEPDVEVLATDGAAGGPERVISQSFNVRYRVGFLPAAFLVRLSCDDPYNQSVLQMERVIRLLQQ
jgi:hypothetical protein